MVHAVSGPIIYSVHAKATPEGTLYAGETAIITGDGLLGALTIQLGNQEPKFVQVVSHSDTSVEFIVPAWGFNAGVSMVITNAAGEKSDYYGVSIIAGGSVDADMEAVVAPIPEPHVSVPFPHTSAHIENVQSAANPEGVIDAGHRASIYGTGLAGPLTIHIGIQNPVTVKAVGPSDGFAEFLMPKRLQSESTVITVTNASGRISNEYRMTVQVDGTLSVETNSVEELIRRGGQYDAREFVEKVGPFSVVPGAIRLLQGTIPTTDTTLLLDIGDTGVAVAPTEEEVVIYDHDFEVITQELTITETGIEVAGNPVSISASDVAATLELQPESIELRDAGDRAVYDMKTDETRNLFGVIPLEVSATIVVDAENAEILEKKLPWYGFMTTEKVDTNLE
jgi:hypothetical protein